MSQNTTPTPTSQTPTPNSTKSTTKEWQTFIGALQNKASAGKINYMLMQTINQQCVLNREYPDDWGAAISNVIFKSAKDTGVTALSTKHCVDTYTQQFHKTCPGLKIKSTTNQDNTKIKSTTKLNDKQIQSTKKFNHKQNHSAVYCKRFKKWSTTKYHNAQDVIRYSFPDGEMKKIAWKIIITKYGDDFESILEKYPKNQADSTETVKTKKQNEYLEIKACYSKFINTNNNCTPIKINTSSSTNQQQNSSSTNQQQNSSSTTNQDNTQDTIKLLNYTPVSMNFLAYPSQNIKYVIFYNIFVIFL